MKTSFGYLNSNLSAKIEILIMSVYVHTDEVYIREEYFFIASTEKSDELQTRQQLYISGDMTSKIGIRKTYEVGQFVDPVTNNNGERIIEKSPS